MPRTADRATWELVRDLRNALAGAMRVLARQGGPQDLIAEMKRSGVADGIGVRAQEWLRKHAPAGEEA